MRVMRRRRGVIRTVRPERFPMLQRLSYIVGAVVTGAGAAMVPPAVVAVFYGETSEAVQILIAATITIIAGVFGWRVVGRQGRITSKEGFAAVGLAWFAMAAFGILPYLLTGSIESITGAFFETAAGFTTTGASVVPDPALLSHGILIWRAETQWIGGMGIIVLSIAILPLLGVGGVQLAKAESPGHQPDRLTPRFRETAKRLWYVYVGFTVLQTILLALGDMNLFQAVAHAMTTMSTGGFGTEATSITGFSPYTQWVIILFMFLAGASFALHFRALRAPIQYVRNVEFRLYTALILGATAIMTITIIGSGPFEPYLRDALFTTTSLMTTTGYATADFGSWVPGVQILAVGLMFLGGMAGSTAGGVKTFRIAVLTKAAAADLRRIVHPRGIFVTRFGKETVSDAVMESIQTFFLFYMFLFMSGTVILGLMSSDLDLVTSASAVASSLGNIGPGLGAVGPTSNFLAIPDAGKWLLSFLMIAGRLEIFPVVLLFTRYLWRR
jgi:trk system potassium uptake protein TrkH